MLARVKAGDKDAFADLYRNFQPGLLRYLRLCTSDPEDIASDTWLSVVNDIRTFSGEEPAFRAWLFTIGRHRAVDAGRVASRRPLYLVGDDTDVLDGAAPDSSEALIERISTDAALALVAELPPDQAEAVGLRVLAGLEVGQVAQVMGRSAGAVRVLTHRGLRTLAARLGDPSAMGVDDDGEV